MIKIFFLVKSDFKYNTYINSILLKICYFYLIVSYSQKILLTSKNDLTNIYFCNIHNIEEDLNNIKPDILIIYDFDEEYIQKIINNKNIKNIICETKLKEKLENNNIYFFEKKKEIINKILLILKDVYKYKIIENDVLKKKISSVPINNSLLKDVPSQFIKNITNYIENNNIIQKSTNNLLKININLISIIYEYKTKEEVIFNLYINNFNIIYHQNQIFNLYQNIQINNNYVYYKNTSYEIKNFIKDINDYSYDYFKALTFRKQKENINKKQDNLIILFIGNIVIGKYILHKIINYKKIEKFNLAICCKYTFTEEIQQYIKKIHNYILYSSNELGNDIVPSLLVWDDLKDKNYKNIIKIHTKSNINILSKSLDFLLTKKIDELQLLKNNDCSCIGNAYMNIKKDFFNKKLLNEHTELIKHNCFVPYSIFLTEDNVLNKVLSFLKKNYKNIFLQNMYDTNMINKEYSYVHFMERLFGYI
jgi:hypothetical protein